MKFNVEIRLLRKKLVTLEWRKERLKALRIGKRDSTVCRINEQIFCIMDNEEELRSIIVKLETMSMGGKRYK